MFVLFNKNKGFIGYSPDIPHQADILKKEIPNSQSDLSIWKWVGDYDSGKMINLYEEGYPEEDLELEQKLFESININYPLGVQLSNIIRQIKKLVDLPQIPQDSIDDSFLDMADEILMAIDLQNKRIKYSQTRKKLHQSHGKTN